MMHHRLFQLLINLYPPYLGTGIRVRRISPDFRRLDVQMNLHWYNRNYVGTHFGGSLYAMVDPFYMLMLMHILGPGYVVWDKAAAIEFLRPGRGKVQARFVVDDRLVDAIHAGTADGGKYFPKLTADISDSGGQLVARVHKTLFIRKKAAR
jgi:acyl-coenzyme A thioesterase PaaI-like protein